MIQSGHNGEYKWIAVPFEITSLRELTISSHIGARLVITAFDSGPLQPSAEELEAGWSMDEGIMISPPLRNTLVVPCEQYDEWYIFAETPRDFRPAEIFVNYGCFTLAPPQELLKTYDATWDRHGVDWLVPLQESFWQIIDRYRPVSYIGRGDNDVIATRNEAFFERLLAAA